jgi:dCTP deaminase
MSVLTETEIKCYMNKPIGERLIVTPLLDPSSCFDPASVNVRLGNEFIVMRKQAFPLLDIASTEGLETKIARYQEKTRLRYGQEFVVHPGQLIIGSTFEYVCVPNKLMCYVTGKSTWGRMGLIIATATKVDPGFKGCITLEIINEGEVPIILYPGIYIAQLVFHKTLSAAQYKGKYSCPTGPQFPDFTTGTSDWAFWYSKLR